jgi:ubiquinone/menaquinone biosynthesis C-methylase UbiE/uncharacterized protein YbaR (Trm112 family)
MHHVGQLRILCPACKTGHLSLESKDDGGIHCSDCSASFPVKDGGIDLLPESQRQRSLSQALMEWEPFIGIYESRWFRKGPGFPLISGISFDKEYEIISQAAKLEGNEILLDLGCGSGIYSRPFARRLNSGMLVGLDLSVPMLNYAGSRARAEGFENLLFIHGDALDLPFPDNEFDVVICCATIHLFPIPDLLRALMEVSRVLKPGGRFTTASLRNWIPGQLSKRFVEWYSRKVGTNYFHPEDLESLFEQAGLNKVECHHARRYWLIMSAVKPE